MGKYIDRIWAAWQSWRGQWLPSGVCGSLTPRSLSCSDACCPQSASHRSLSLSCMAFVPSRPEDVAPIDE
eukprot:scaffold510533_cov17-Prasinocladus_malaysianus.AAC.1